MNALYSQIMSRSGDLKLSSRGQMSLPAAARHRWGLEDGGDLAYIDVGEFLIVLPGGVPKLRRELLDQMTAQDWADARAGFGDPDLATE